MAQHRLRQAGDDRLSYDRWQVEQTRREVAAINGELGQAAQIIALSEVYRELRLAGNMDEAAEIKRRVNLIVTEV